MKLETLLLTRLQVSFHFCKRFGVFRPTLKLLDESRDSTLQLNILLLSNRGLEGKNTEFQKSKRRV